MVTVRWLVLPKCGEEAAEAGSSHLGDEAKPSHDADRLRRIAEALGIPEAALLNGSATAAEIDAMTEMLRIWISLEHAADRQKILAFARTLAAARQ